jgi:1-acyl-sn-glycerol-3-phosphate acyltransferase
MHGEAGCAGWAEGPEGCTVRRERGGPWIGLAAGFFYPIGWLSGRPRFEGLENIPRTGGAVVAANHLSHIDPIYSGLAVHLAGRVPRFLAKDGLWRVPVLGTVLRATAQIPVFRGTADAKASLRDGVTALQDGKVLVVYPEGTISRDPARWPMHPRTGVARLALGSGAPVVPMVHWGTHAVLDGYAKRYRPLPRTTVTVRCGPPVDLSAYRDRPVDAAVLREVTDLVMGRVRDLLAEVRAEPAPAGFYRRTDA